MTVTMTIVFLVLGSISDKTNECFGTFLFSFYVFQIFYLAHGRKDTWVLYVTRKTGDHQQISIKWRAIVILFIQFIVL